MQEINNGGNLKFFECFQGAACLKRDRDHPYSLTGHTWPWPSLFSHSTHVTVTILILSQHT